MQDTLARLGIKFKDPKQDRSYKTLDDLLDAATLLVKNGDPDKFTARELARISGYSLGTTSRRLVQIENVFLCAIDEGRKRYFDGFINFINNCDPAYKVQYFCNDFAHLCISQINKASPEVMKFFESRLLQRTKKGTYSDGYVDFFKQSMISLSQRNTSGTFREIHAGNVNLIVKPLAVALERPFLEDDPIAGTMEHKEQLADLMYRVLRA